MMDPYDPVEYLSQLIKQLEKIREFTRSVGKTISNVMMVYKGIALWEQTTIFNKDTIYWRRQITNLKTWARFKTFLHQAHREQNRAITTAYKEGYTSAVINIYGVMPPPLE